MKANSDSWPNSASHRKDGRSMQYSQSVRQTAELPLGKLCIHYVQSTERVLSAQLQQQTDRPTEASDGDSSSRRHRLPQPPPRPPLGRSLGRSVGRWLCLFMTHCATRSRVHEALSDATLR